jgi:hypothetical protein
MGSDKNYESHVSENGTVIKDRIIPDENINPLDYSDILKFSNSSKVIVENCTIRGGKEDCIDIVRGEMISIKDTKLIPSKNGITIKGSVNDVNLDNVQFENRGSECDIELGQFDNYWYIGRPPTRGISLKNISSKDGKPVVVRIWDAESPVVENSNVKIVKIPKFVWWFYFVYRAIQTRGWSNITKPVESNVFITTK